MSQFSTAVKFAITVVTFLVAIGIASGAFQLLLGNHYPAWTLVVALAVTAPVMILLWRDRLS
jgi:hypothetical protein